MLQKILHLIWITKYRFGRQNTRNRPRVHVLNTLHADNQPNHQLTTFKWSPRDEVGDDEDFVCPAKLPLGDSKRN